MLEFTSALYLGLRHGSWSLEPWSQLTTGSPAAFAVPTAARAVARELAALQGCAAATLGPSTLHLFWDLGELFAESGAAIYLDSGTYPIGKWGMERAAAHGAQLRRFSHHDPDALWRLLRSESRNRRPVVVSDGFCPGCGRPAPLEAYLELARRGDGWLVIDDTQALGIFGHSPDGSRPFGEGGGGMARWSRISDPRLVVVASLAKAFGAPLAALSGSVAFVERFEKRSGTRMHCSPPSAAVLSAAARALTINRRRGEILRARLTSLVRHFRASLRAIGIVPTGGVFPVTNAAAGRGNRCHRIASATPGSRDLDCVASAPETPLGLPQFSHQRASHSRDDRSRRAHPRRGRRLRGIKHQKGALP